MSGFGLFSQVRGAEQTSYQLWVTDSFGAERAVNLNQLPERYSGSLQLLALVPTMGRAQQRATVSAWLTAAGIAPADVSAAKVQRVVYEVPTDGDTTPSEAQRDVVAEVTFP